MASIEWLPRSVYDPFLRSPLHIQLHVAINTVNTFMIEAMTIKADPVITFPEAPARTLLNDPVQCVDNRLVTLQPVFPWPI